MPRLTQAACFNKKIKNLRQSTVAASLLFRRAVPRSRPRLFARRKSMRLRPTQQTHTPRRPLTTKIQSSGFKTLKKSRVSRKRDSLRRRRFFYVLNALYFFFSSPCCVCVSRSKRTEWGLSRGWGRFVLKFCLLRSAYWSLVLRRSGRPFPPSLTYSTVVLYYQCIPSTSRSTLPLSPVSQPAFHLQIPLPLSTIVYILLL